MAFILVKDGLSYSEIIDFDATLRATHLGQNVVTGFPIEADSNGETTLNDHSIKQPETFELEVGVTNTPISNRVFGSRQGEVRPVKLNIERFRLAETVPVFPTSVPSFGIRVALQERRIARDPSTISALVWEQFDSILEYFEKLEEIRINANICDVVTENRTYRNVLLTSVGNVNDQSSGDAAVFRLAFTTINVVTTSIVAAPVEAAELRAQEKAQQQAKNPKPSTKGTGAADGTNGTKKSVLYKFLEQTGIKDAKAQKLRNVLTGG